jgi:hypothetical protein
MDTYSILRIKQLNGSQYITVQNNSLVLESKNDNKNQYWEIRKLDNTICKLTNLSNGKSMTVSASSLQEGALLSLSGDDDNGWDGYWTVYEGLATDMILAPPVDHAGLSTTGNRLTANLSTATGLRASRKLNPKWNDDGDAIWISFLLETNIPDGNLENWIGLSFPSRRNFCCPTQ